MNRTVTLDLPADVLDQAGDIAQRSGRSLETLLTEWITGKVAAQNSNTLLTDEEYPIFTLHGNDAVAEALFATLQAAKAAKRRNAKEG
ncbi:MAG: hypothetical protein M3Z04_16865 [Chloroflexota bacterium]|nr:hypothetical protein [Chloroflexota bacterium]